MRVLVVFFVLLLGGAMPAWAAKPQVVPAPDWISASPIPSPNPDLASRASQTLLQSTQYRFGGGDGDEIYVETAMIAQNAQGVAQMGTIALPWSPDQADLLVHKVHIRRGETVIDLLEAGHEFAVLRRENNLERAMLDGMLTAMMTAEGLTSGDILHIAYSYRRKSGAIAFRSEAAQFLLYGNPTRKALFRAVWDDGVDLKWRAATLFGTAAIARNRREIRFDLTDVEGPRYPEMAPPHYALAASLEMTAYADWGEIAGLMAPLYDEARRLRPQSPLQREIDAIVARTNDPRARAMAALRLVQDEIRYLALAMGDAGYVPASADQTWARRFGDCKGKTTTLLALLDALGIEAEPVLVSTLYGSALNTRLPMLLPFDHVIVRAKIDGQSYWMDGARSGDRVLEDLRSSPHGWGLPIRATGAALEQLPLLPPAQPTTFSRTIYDASEGLADLVPTRVEMVMRGDDAANVRTAIGQIGQDQFLQAFQDSMEFDNGEEVRDVQLHRNDDEGSVSIHWNLLSRMDWTRRTGSAMRRFQLEDETIGWNLRTQRSAGADPDAPYRFHTPLYIASEEIVLLPENTQGFALEGQNLNIEILGVHIMRTLELAQDKLIARSTFRRLEAEFSADAVRAAAETLRAVNNDRAYLVAPAGTAVRTETTEEVTDADAESLFRRGFEQMQRHNYREAHALMEQASAVDPDYFLPHANRAVMFSSEGRFAEAKNSLREAERMEPDDFIVHQAWGLIDLGEGRPDAAVDRFTKSLEKSPDNVFNLGHRARAYVQREDYALALADWSRVIELEPANVPAHSERLHILVHLGRAEEARARMAQFPETAGRSFYGQAFFAELSRSIGDRESADRYVNRALALFDDGQSAASTVSKAEQVVFLADMERFREALRIADQNLREYADGVPMLIARCHARMVSGTEQAAAQRDCDNAVEFDPGNLRALRTRALLHLRRDSPVDAAADYDAILEITPNAADALYGRGLARLRQGARDAGEADIAAAKRITLRVAAPFDRLGLRP